MSHAFPLRQRAFSMLVLLILFLLSSGPAAGQGGLKGLFGGDKNPTYQIFKDPAGRFEVEYPNKDWKLLPAGGSSMAVFSCSCKDGPTLYVDHLKLVDRLTQGEIDAMPGIELNRIKDLEPTGKDFKSEMLESKAGRGVLIRFSRPTETVVQYSIPAGQDLFRLTGVLPQKQLSKFEPIVRHMIESFKAPADPSAAKN
jgi:hypothetical protein